MANISNANIFKDLKDIMTLNNSTEEILKEVNYMVNFLYTKIKTNIRYNQKCSTKAT